MIMVQTLLALLLQISFCRLQLSTEISNTQQMLNLYHQKLNILQQLSEKNGVSSEDSSQPTINLGFTPKMEIFRIKLISEGNCVFVPPHFYVNDHKLYDVDGNLQNVEITGEVIITNRYQVTSKVQEGLVVTHFKQEVSKKAVKIFIKEGWSFLWHKAYQFEDRLLQWRDNQLLFCEPDFSRLHSFKSPIIGVFPINQYKLLYVTKYESGILNARTFQLMGHHNFQSMVNSAIKSEGILFVLLRNNTLLTIFNQKIISSTNISRQLVPESPHLSYIPPYIIISSDKDQCFSVFDGMKQQKIQYLKQICLPDTEQLLKQSLSHTYKMNFFIHDNAVKLFVTFNITHENITSSVQSHIYQLFLQVKQPGSESSFPYKLLFVVIGVIGIMVFRGRSTKQRKQIPVKQIQKGRSRKVQGSLSQIDDYLSKIKSQKKQAKGKSL